MLELNANADGVWHNANLLPAADPEHAITDGTLVVEDGRIAWLGARPELPPAYAALPRHDAAGRWITPGLVDCHTHLVFAGQRSDEFALRLEGASYEDIARRGGGILSTVRATRAASEEGLYSASAPRLAGLLAEGVTAIEIKSGYGLDLAADAAGDGGHVLEVAGLAAAGGVEVDDVDPARSGRLERAGDGDRVVGVHGLGGVVALHQAHGLPAPQVDRRIELNHRRRRSS